MQIEKRLSRRRSHRACSETGRRLAHAFLRVRGLDVLNRAHFICFVLRRCADQTVILSQFVHLRCSIDDRPCAAFVKFHHRCRHRRRADLHAVCAQLDDLARFPRQKRDRLGSGGRVEFAMKRKVQVGECEYQDRLKSLLKVFNTELQPLRSLETVTKKRRALKKRSEGNTGPTKSGTTASC